jgi:hypothetical protein
VCKLFLGCHRTFVDVEFCDNRNIVLLDTVLPSRYARIPWLFPSRCSCIFLSSSFPHPSLASPLLISVQCALCSQSNSDHYRRRSSVVGRRKSPFSFLQSPFSLPATRFFSLISLISFHHFNRLETVWCSRSASSVVVLLTAKRKGIELRFSPQSTPFPPKGRKFTHAILNFL